MEGGSGRGTRVDKTGGACRRASKNRSLAPHPLSSPLPFPTHTTHHQCVARRRGQLGRGVGVHGVEREGGGTVTPTLTKLGAGGWWRRAGRVPLCPSNQGRRATGEGVREGDERIAFLPLCHVAERMIGEYVPIMRRSVVNFVENPETVFESMEDPGSQAVLHFAHLALAGLEETTRNILAGLPPDTHILCGRLAVYERTYTAWKAPDEARLVTRVQHAMIHLTDAHCRYVAYFQLHHEELAGQVRRLRGQLDKLLTPTGVALFDVELGMYEAWQLDAAGQA